MKFYDTGSHGYLQVTVKELVKALKKGFIPTTCSYVNVKKQME